MCFLPPRSEALFPPVLSWLMFVWINIEQEAMISQGVSGRQEVKQLCLWWLRVCSLYYPHKSMTVSSYMFRHLFPVSVFLSPPLCLVISHVAQGVSVGCYFASNWTSSNTTTSNTTTTAKLLTARISRCSLSCSRRL